MSREDVELVRAMLPRNNARAARDPALMQAMWHPDCEWTSALVSVDMRTYHGHRGLLEYVEEMEAAFEDWLVEPEHVVDAGSGRVVATWWIAVRGRGSGAAVRHRGGGVFELEGDLIRRGSAYLDPDDAFRAAGLDPPQRA